MSRARNSKGLTDKEEKIAIEYVKCNDMTKAYELAGYSMNFKNRDLINQKASVILAKANVATRVKELQEKARKVAEKEFIVDSKEITRHLEILRKARIDEYVEFIEVITPITRTRTITTGKGKNATTEVITETDERREFKTVFKTFDKLTADQLMAIESVKQDRYGQIELKLHGKQWTIDMINKHLGYYAKDNEQKKPEIEVNPIDMSKLPTETLMALAAASKPKDGGE
jgi:phage terminase small subunit